ncbi:sensor histidine kinase KdpD [Pedobacter sp. L105]|uniref:sensor histidine kinase n=1 Tax=Pedobacter sp. L105 TaxID=1641871 RepID=UPI00131C703A|nr:HAMP domain-containing sensor histidine kinase [Pedobacter sp. L105]
MKWFNAKYTYVLIVLSLVLCTGLQVMWLQQLFLAQRKQLKEEIEHVISNTAQTNVYLSLTTLKRPGNLRQIKQLFLSPEWDQLRQSFDNMRTLHGMNGTFSISIDNDSTSVMMKFSLKDVPVHNHNQTYSNYGGMTKAQVIRNDRISLLEMKKKVVSNLRLMGITSKIYHIIYVYNRSKIQINLAPKGGTSAFTSKLYAYDIQNFYKYQLYLPTINSIVWYRMRYYLVSSVLMILLTCTAFYFILRLLRKQQLYAHARADFASNMTHEFKTPIATVSVALESIKKYNLINDPETLQNYLDISQHELQRLNLMVEKVLNISQDNDGNHPLHLELYDVQSGLQQVISSMQLQLLNSHASIRLNASAEPCFVFGDPVHLTNVFYNLIDNAIKYAVDTLELQIDCECDAGRVVLSFKDNGPGIEKIYQETIFERFFRIPGEGSTHNVKGSGLGLHYVKGMVEKHKGTLKLKSEPGKGSNFIITLPAAI